MADKIVREGLRKASAARAVLVLEFGDQYAYLGAATHRLCRKYTDREDELLAAARLRRDVPAAQAAAELLPQPPSSDLLRAQVEKAPRKHGATRAERIAHARDVARVVVQSHDVARTERDILAAFVQECERRGVDPAQLPEETLRSILMEVLLGPRE
jgi:hypothetical protein